MQGALIAMKKIFLNLKIRTKLSAVLLAAVVIPALTIGLTFSADFRDMVISNTISRAQKSSATASPILRALSIRVQNVANDLSSSAYYQKLFLSAAPADFSEAAKTASAQDFLTKIHSYQAEGFRTRIYIDLPEDSDFFTSPSASPIFAPLKQARGRYWYGIFQGSSADHLYCPSSYLGPTEAMAYGDSAYIRRFRFIYQGKSLSGYLAVYYSSDLYREALRDNLPFLNGVSYLINDRNQIIAETDMARSATYRVDYDQITGYLESSNAFVEKNVLGADVYAAFQKIPGPSWYLVTIIPKSSLISQGNQIILRYLAIILVCIFGGVLIAELLAGSIVRRIRRVSSQMSQVKAGDTPSPLAPSPYNDEVGQLVDSYNYMADRINDLVAEQQKISEEKTIAEFNALQAQINPHFLYNTMDMIHWMAQTRQYDKVSEIVMKLSRFYKLTLSKKDPISTIGDEIEHASIYVQLQNMRFENAIDLVVDIPDELSSFQIPKLTLQPILENAILHGIREKDPPTGTIVITAWEDDAIYLLISDDGIGMDQERVDHLLSYTPMSKARGANVAIYNIHSRLQLLYGPEYGLNYKSVPGQGTEVTIRVPL